MAAPSLDPRTYAALAFAVLLVRRDIPALTVTITPRTDDRAWVIDHCCSRVWLSAELAGPDLLGALDDAVKALQARQGVEGALAWMPRQRCGDHAHSGLAAG